jgi:hypothetical protein
MADVAKQKVEIGLALQGGGFSPPTVARRRRDGCAWAREKLVPLFDNHRLVGSDRRPPESARS